jgi:hypothetical protein
LGTLIVKLGDHYLEWSSISDSPATYGMTLEEFKAYYLAEYGREGMRELPARLARVEAKGTSSFDAQNADDTIWLNRAGPDEAILHREEIIEFYVVRKEAPTDTGLKAFRAGLRRCGPTCSYREKDGVRVFCKQCWGTDYVRDGPS